MNVIAKRDLYFYPNTRVKIGTSGRVLDSDSEAKMRGNARWPEDDIVSVKFPHTPKLMAVVDELLLREL